MLLWDLLVPIRPPSRFFWERAINSVDLYGLPPTFISLLEGREVAVTSVSF